MAKKSVIARDEQRRKLVEKYAKRREAVKKTIVDDSLPMEERWAAMMQLQKLPRDSSSSRLRNRCGLTGRPRGFYRKFGLSRNRLREVILRGEAPGVIKASW